MDEQLAEDFDAPDHELDARDHYVASHSLRSAAAGATLPDLWFARDGAIMNVAWHDSMDGDIYFTLSRGEADLPANDVADSIRGFVEWVRNTLVHAQAAVVTEDIDLLLENHPSGGARPYSAEVSSPEPSHSSYWTMMADPGGGTA
jgi:hypothetical protein